MTDLTKIKIEDLEAEIERRKKYYSIVVHQVEFDLTLEEVKELQGQLNKINPPADPFNVWKTNQEEIARRMNRIWVQPPINPGWPNPKSTGDPYPSSPTIWCGSKPEAPLWNGSATS